jgi:restriction system protein
MAVPDFQSLLLPLLRLTADGKIHTTTEAIDALAAEFHLTPEDREELLPSGKQRRFVNRVNWGTTHLRKAGLLTSAGSGKFQITGRGQQVLASAPPRIDMKFLGQFPGYKEFLGSGDQPANGAKHGAATLVDQTPEELMATTHRQLEDGLEQDLLDKILSVTPTFFEQLVVDLLVKMGYGGSTDAAQRIGKAGDGGIDGTIFQDPLGLDIVYVQAKRWNGSVSRPTVQAFAGSLEGFKATKGVLITTSTFTADAQTYVGQIGKRIVLVDGRMLARLMIKHGLAVSPTATYVVNRIDNDYFEAGVG